MHLPTPRGVQRIDVQSARDMHAAAVDATDARAVTAFVRDAEAALGPIDALVNNAAIGQDSLHVHTSPERIAAIVDTNLTAPLLLTRQVLRRILALPVAGELD